MLSAHISFQIEVVMKNSLFLLMFINIYFNILYLIILKVCHAADMLVLCSVRIFRSRAEAAQLISVVCTVLRLITLMIFEKCSLLTLTALNCKSLLPVTFLLCYLVMCLSLIHI